MSFPKNPISGLEKEISAGGTDNVPPALCPPTAHASAYVPARVERIGRAGTNETDEAGVRRHPGENTPFLFMELTA